MTEEITFRLRQGRLIHKIKGLMLVDSGRIYIHFGYNKALISEIKSFENHHWHGKIPGSDYKPKSLPAEFLKVAGTDKCWSIANNHRNRFQLAYLLGGNPYSAYDAEIKTNSYERSLYAHQKEMTDFLLARQYAIIAGEMGTGKTLCAIEVMERSGHTDWWYVAPKSVLKTIERELKLWNAQIRPELMTYNRLVSLMEKWPEGNKAPHGVIFDESARVKTPTSQRSQAAKQLADGIRADWGKDGYVILMSGAPAPKAPTDWWHQCEVACPGFIKEGTLGKFKVRLGVFEEKQSFAGGVYLEQVTWLDNEDKCAKCGQLEEHANHVPGASAAWHPRAKSVNEISNLYKRLNGLVIVKFKKDCLDLPDKVYREIECKPSPSTLRAAQLIARTSATTIQALTLLRELDDGFQYVDTIIGKEECPLCHGQPYFEQQFDSENQTKVDCPNCNGSGQSDKISREAQQVACPKEDVLKDLLDQHEEVGRLVTYAGFTGSVDRCVQTSLSEGWVALRVDGRGWKLFLPEGMDVQHDNDYLSIFQDRQDKFPRVNFIGQPSAAGSGHTLTASPSIFYYSNDFNADSRIQSEDRIHRIGMDMNRGATIIDVFHLPVGKLVLDNLKKKRKLQSLSLGEITACLEQAIKEERLF